MSQCTHSDRPTSAEILSGMGGVEYSIGMKFWRIDGQRAGPRGRATGAMELPDTTSGSVPFSAAITVGRIQRQQFGVKVFRFGGHTDERARDQRRRDRIVLMRGDHRGRGLIALFA